MEQWERRSCQYCCPDWHVRCQVFIQEGQPLLIGIDSGKVQEDFPLGDLVELSKGDAGTEAFLLEMIDNVVLELEDTD